MHMPVPITEDIYWVGVNDRQTTLFEGLWPLPRGVSYNSYIIVDEKTALVDTVKEQSTEIYLDKIRRVLDAGKQVDYLIVNHMEPDHSGSIRILHDLFPELTIIGNRQTKRFLGDFYGLADAVQVVKDGDTLDLGRHKLKFYMTPMVHWPETMMTYDTGEKVLFSGDAFGGFGALTGGIFDDELDLPYFEDEILRYFSNIVGKYSDKVQRAIAKLGDLPLNVIAATHGAVWRHEPETIVKLYDRWSRHEAEEGVVLVYASMYGNTERMMDAVATGLSEEDLARVRIYNVSTTHISYLIRDAWRYQGLILGSPTYDRGLFPLMDHFIGFLEHKDLRKRTLGLFGTFGWSGGGVKSLKAFAEDGDWDIVEPIVEARCCPSEEDLRACRDLGQNLVRRIKDEG